MPVTNYIWDVTTDSYLMETDENDATTAVYTNGPGQFGPVISQRRGANSHFFHRDALGSVVDVTDAAQGATDSYLYKAYGEILAASGSTITPFRFVGSLGYYYDLDLAQYYIRARQYHPVLARWLSVDPIEDEAGAVNAYAYVQSNPVTYVDPSGKWQWPFHWHPSDCPCFTCEDTNWGKPGVDKQAVRKLAEALKAQMAKTLKGAGIEVKIVTHLRCHSIYSALACPAVHGKFPGKRAVLVCIPEGVRTLDPGKPKTGLSTCTALQAVEHEFVHARQFADFFAGRGQLTRKQMEEEAYGRSCEVEAQQECLEARMTMEKKQEWIEQCVKEATPRSLGKDIEGKFATFCRRLIGQHLPGYRFPQ